MAYPASKIQNAIQVAIAEYEFSDEVSHDIGFHMTDWLGDLERWHAFCSDPDSLDPGQLRDLLMGFLIHVPAHIAAARKLYVGAPMEDIFEVGIFDEED